MPRRQVPEADLRQAAAVEVARRSGRRTARLDGLIQHLGVALGGRPGAGRARRLMLPVGKDTCCALSAASGDGTILCDLEQRHIVDQATACCAASTPWTAGEMTDIPLTVAIRAVLAASPFHGEGHRKVWARLRHTGTRS